MTLPPAAPLVRFTLLRATPAGWGILNAIWYQTEIFLRDPANALPQYPLWDMNRRVGP